MKKSKTVYEVQYMGLPVWRTSTRKNLMIGKGRCHKWTYIEIPLCWRGPKETDIEDRVEEKIETIHTVTDDTIRKSVYVKYAGMLNSSAKRGHSKPDFNRDDLFKWALEKTSFKVEYINWVNSGKCRHLCPVFDRIDDEVGYTFSNMQVLTNWENLRKASRDGLKRKEQGIIKIHNCKVTKSTLFKLIESSSI
jgi:hypothetical protein